MSDTFDEGTTVSDSTDLDMERVQVQREEIQESLRKLRELQEHSRQLAQELEQMTIPLRKALENLGAQLESPRQSKRMVRNLGLSDVGVEFPELNGLLNETGKAGEESEP